jgi:hypothetical protein
MIFQKNIFIKKYLYIRTPKILYDAPKHLKKYWEGAKI